MKKDNIIMKYSIGLFLITIITLLIQKGIVIIFHDIEFTIEVFLLVISIIIVPIIGIHILQKFVIKKENVSMDSSNLLSKIFIISFIYMLLATLYIVVDLNILINTKEALYVIGDGLTSSEMLEKATIGLTKMSLLSNAKYVISGVLFSTLYITFIVFVYIRKWINNILQVEKSVKKAQLKQLILPIIMMIIILMIQIGIASYYKKYEEKMEISISVRLEPGISINKRKKIENELNQIDEIIKYQYKSNEEKLRELQERFGENTNLLSSYEGENNIFSSSYEIIIHAKDKEKVNKKLQKIDGIKK